jgi:uncharacterized protein YceH (UPF0502 family)
MTESMTLEELGRTGLDGIVFLMSVCGILLDKGIITPEELDAQTAEIKADPAFQNVRDSLHELSQKETLLRRLFAQSGNINNDVLQELLGANISETEKKQEG